MKAKIIGILVTMLLISTAVNAVGNMKNEVIILPIVKSGVEWEQTYGYDEFEWIYDIQPTSDGGYIATGVSEEDDMNYGWLLKVDEGGSKQWDIKNYDFNGTDESEIFLGCVRETSDGGYIVGGLGWFYSTIYDAWIAVGRLWKVNSAGETIFFKYIGNELEMWSLIPENIIEIEDGFICGGFLAQYTETEYFQYVALFKTDLNGELDWKETYVSGNLDFARSLWKCDPSHEGYFLSGTTSYNDETDLEAYYMVKTDNSGEMEWDAIFDGPSWDYSPTMGCHQTPDGGYVMAGISASYGAGLSDVWIVKTNDTGVMEWDKTYGEENNDRCYGMTPTENGYAFLIIKDAYMYTGTRDDIWIVETDYDGNTEWEFLLEKEGIQWMQSIYQTDDKGFIIGGRTGAMNNKTSDALLMKIEPFPHLDVEIKGGLGIKAIITNNGLGDAVDITYEITVEGGILDKINKTDSGNISISAGESKTISIKPFFGFGSIQVTLNVGFKEVNTEGMQLILFSFI